MATFEGKRLLSAGKRLLLPPILQAKDYFL
jgi:hypothetical protein